MYVECGSMYRAEGPEAMRSVGEVEFAGGVAAMSASGGYGPCRAISGIVGAADLRLGDRVQPVLEALKAAGDGRLRGVRMSSTWTAAPMLGNVSDPRNRGLLADADFRRGFARLEPMGLSFDAWCYQTQLHDVADLAWAFPHTRIVLDHLGGPLRIGPYAGRPDQGFADWKAGMRALAQHPNVVVKVGGLGMPTFSRYVGAATPPTSAQLASDWAPLLEVAVETFGPDRCMLESNFPVDKLTCDYRTLWNAFKRITAGCSESEKAALFGGTGRSVYNLPTTKA
jgi:predicted TIM-barrel fold metal-dependent hydrolase